MNVTGGLPTALPDPLWTDGSIEGRCNKHTKAFSPPPKCQNLFLPGFQTLQPSDLHVSRKQLQWPELRVQSALSLPLVSTQWHLPALALLLHCCFPQLSQLNTNCTHEIKMCTCKGVCWSSAFLNKMYFNIFSFAWSLVVLIPSKHFKKSRLQIGRNATHASSFFLFGF